MPVHSREKKDSNHDEMEVDFPEQDGSSTDEEDTVSSTVSEDGDSSGWGKGLQHDRQIISANSCVRHTRTHPKSYRVTGNELISFRRVSVSLCARMRRMRGTKWEFQR